MDILFRLKRPLDRLLEVALVLLFFSLFGCVILQVFTRYVLNDPAIFTEEASRISIIWLSLLGTAYACGRLEHMAYSMFPDKLKDGALWSHMRTVAVVVMAFAASVMCFGGSKLILRALQFNQGTATLGLPMGYVYLCIPISGAVIVFYQILILIQPKKFKGVDEAQAAIAHAEEEERKLAADNAGKEKQA